jgi:Asp-tRNA(Asn)/Glu-tRNA(Gln) amidotransferase A subunit family amidase
MDLSAIYTELIMEHNKSTHNRRHLYHPDCTERGHNPSCGDDITLEVKFNEDTIEDAALLLGALTGIDENDPATLLSEGKSYTDYTQFLNKDGLKGARIGVPRKNFLEHLPEEEKKLYDAEIEVLRNLGAVIVDPADIESAGELHGYEVLIYEFKSDMNAYLSTLGSNAPVKTLQDIIDYNNEHREAALKYGQTILIQSEAASGNLTEPEYINARQNQKTTEPYRHLSIPILTLMALSYWIWKAV